MQCSMTISALSIFGAKTKIALAGVRSIIRKSLAKTANIIISALYFLLKLTYMYFLVNKRFSTFEKEH